MMHKGRRRALVACWCGLVMCAVGGCQFAPKTPTLRWPWAEKSPPPQPERVLAVWTDTVLHQPSQPGIRGFGGRIYFYEKDATDPIEIDGGLAVYVFDADKLQLQDQRPQRKFVFTAEQFASHMSRTSLGPSYSVWLPWGEVGGPPQRLSLIVRFEGSQGGTTISDPTIKLLPGVPNQEVASEQELSKRQGGQSSHVQLAGHTNPLASDEPTEEAKPASRARDIKTIDLPPSFQRHLRREDGASHTDDSTNREVPQVVPFDASNQASGVPSQNSSAMRSSPADSQSALRDLEVESQVTTQVSDYRSRSRQFASQNAFASPETSGVSPKLDIREGRWIESLPRLGRD